MRVCDAGGLGAFTWTQVVTLSGALIAAGAVVLTLLVSAGRARRENWATLYADALGAIAEYLEGPYRILRKDGASSTRLAITARLSDVKTAIDHSQALRRLHCHAGVADAFDQYVTVAKQEAGQQMHDAWLVDPVTADAGMNLDVALPRDRSTAARDLLVEVMQAHLRRRWYSKSSPARYNAAVTAATKIARTIRVSLSSNGRYRCARKAICSAGGMRWSLPQVALTVHPAAPERPRGWPCCMPGARSRRASSSSQSRSSTPGFTAKVESLTSVGDVPAVVPSVSGQAWITDIAQVVLDPSDPFPTGYALSDTWSEARPIAHG